jgi:hypothetical protein
VRGCHYVVKNWPNHTDNVPGRKNVINPAFVEKTKIFLPPLHIKLGLTKKLREGYGQRMRRFCLPETKIPSSE